MRDFAGHPCCVLLLVMIAYLQVACHTNFLEGNASGNQASGSSENSQITSQSMDIDQAIDEHLDQSVIDQFQESYEYIWNEIGDEEIVIEGVVFWGLESFYDLFYDQVENSEFADLTIRELLEDAEIDIDELKAERSDDEKIENFHNLSEMIEELRDSGSEFSYGLLQGLPCLRLQGLGGERCEDVRARRNALSEASRRQQEQLETGARSFADCWRTSTNRAACLAGSTGALGAASSQVQPTYPTDSAETDTP